MKGWVLPAALALCACSHETPGGPAAAVHTDTPAEVGARIYSQNCVPCHRDDGSGVPSVYPALSGSPVVNGNPKELAQWVLSGKRPPSMPSGRYSTQMLLFGWLKDADAAALLTYVRSSFGNSSPPVDPAAVAAAR